MINVRLKKYSSVPSNYGAEVTCGTCGASCVFLRTFSSYSDKECWSCKTIILNPLKMVDHQFERVKYHDSTKEENR